MLEEKRNMIVLMDLNGFQRWQEAGNEDIPAADVKIITSGRQRILAHSHVLASASSVFENILDPRRKRGMSAEVIPIFGVPCDAVLAFVRFLYSARCVSEEDAETMDKYGIHLMVLSHVYMVRWLKRACEVGLASRLTVESVVDVLQLARQCDAPRLYLRCMKLVHKNFASVEKTEGWIFLQNHDPSLELEILQFLDEADLSEKRRRRKMEEQRVYLQLSEAMECLQHICNDGCTDVGPYEGRKTPNGNKGPSCPSYNTCRALQLLIHHLASCRTNRATCPRCRRLWNLLRLHSSICDFSDPCKVPLCRQFKLRMQQIEGKVEAGRWRLLAKKLVLVRVMSSLVKRENRI